MSGTWNRLSATIQRRRSSGKFKVYNYLIRPNYHTGRLGFSKLLGALISGKISIYLPVLRIPCKDQEKTYLMMIMRFFSDFLYKGICCGYSFELHRQVNAIQIDTHNICLYKEVDKQYTGCNLKTTELLDCALIGVCVVIRLYTVNTGIIALDKVLIRDKMLFFFNPKVLIFFLFLHENILRLPTIYRIQPNYCTVHLDFQNYWTNL